MPASGDPSRRSGGRNFPGLLRSYDLFDITQTKCLKVRQRYSEEEVSSFFTRVNAGLRRLDSTAGFAGVALEAG